MRRRIRNSARLAVSALVQNSPEPVSRALRAFVERLAYRNTAIVHELPPIFHYWSNRYLRPRFERLGFNSPEDLYALVARNQASKASAPLRCLSVASGRCDAEFRLAARLRDQGIDVSFTCVDMNASLINSARAESESNGLASAFAFVCSDIKDLDARQVGQFDLVLANQCLHHFLELEVALDFMHESLADDGVLVTSDVIGRNGHMLWPEALAEMSCIWAELPRRLRRDHTRGGSPRCFHNYNHANVGFEGIRAQDILAALIQRFDFEYFVPNSCLIMPLVDRRFGWNYDADDPGDRAIIDEVHQRDQMLLNNGTLKPTQLIASMRRKGRAGTLLSDFPFRPEDCVRPVGN